MSSPWESLINQCSNIGNLELKLYLRSEGKCLPPGNSESMQQYRKTWIETVPEISGKISSTRGSLINAPISNNLN
jgi:hypothetical protein